MKIEYTGHTEPYTYFIKSFTFEGYNYRCNCCECNFHGNELAIEELTECPICKAEIRDIINV